MTEFPVPLGIRIIHVIRRSKAQRLTAAWVHRELDGEFGHAQVARAIDALREEGVLRRGPGRGGPLHVVEPGPEAA